MELRGIFVELRMTDDVADAVPSLEQQLRAPVRAIAEPGHEFPEAERSLIVDLGLHVVVERRGEQAFTFRADAGSGEHDESLVLERLEQMLWYVERKMMPAETATARLSL